MIIRAVRYVYQSVSILNLAHAAYIFDEKPLSSVPGSDPSLHVSLAELLSSFVGAPDP